MTQRKTGGCQLLIHEAPLQILPSLAVAVGLNEAIILQQLHYWLQRSEHTMEGKPWIYNTFVQWQTQFPFWHFNTIKRAMHHLEELGVVEATTRFNRNPIDKTWWYTINYERLEDFCRPPMNQDDSSTDHQGSSTDHQGSTMNHLDTLDEPSWLDRQTIMVHVPEITSEITTEIPDPPLLPPVGKVPSKRPGKPKAPTYLPGFLAFWNCYPHERRASKPTCLKVWIEKALEDRTAEICEKVERLKVTLWVDRQPTYIPLVLTWLNAGDYDDDLMPIPRAIITGGRVSPKTARNAEASSRIIEEIESGRTGQSPLFRGTQLHG